MIKFVVAGTGIAGRYGAVNQSKAFTFILKE